MVPKMDASLCPECHKATGYRDVVSYEVKIDDKQNLKSWMCKQCFTFYCSTDEEFKKNLITYYKK